MSGTFILFHFLRLQADQHQPGLCVPGAGSDFRGHAKGFAVLRLRVVIAEVVQHFLNADTVRGNPFPAQDLPPQQGVGRGVHVRREGGQGRSHNAQEAVALKGGVLLRVPFSAVSLVGSG